MQAPIQCRWLRCEILLGSTTAAIPRLANGSSRRLGHARPLPRRLLGAIALAFAAAIAGCHAQEEKAAIEAANQWLALVDSGRYAESWERSGSLFRDSVSAERWETMVTSARRPFGQLISRRVGSARYTDWLPGAPDGQYVLIQYEAEYEKKREAIETVTPQFENGEWRVSGYFIK